MKISERFGLGKTQFELDFVDIDPDFDKQVFLDPYFLGMKRDAFSIRATRTVRSFFTHFIGLINEGDHEAARLLFNHFEEPHETCLGLSKGKPRGLGVNSADADRIFTSILQSKAVKSGLVEHLEDFRVFVFGVDKDKISDMTTNLVRRHLLQYTQEQCELWQMPLTQGVPTGFFWDPASRSWQAGYDRSLIVNGNRILLVPKGIVSFAKRYSPTRFHRQYRLEFLQNEHLKLGSALVEYRADDTPFVTKKRLESEIAPFDKDGLATFVQAHPKIFAEFREELKQDQRSLEDVELTSFDVKKVIAHLIDQLKATPPGNDNASKYHRIMVGVLEMLFYPSLICPQVEVEINSGRRRIDLTFDNAAARGEFWRLSQHFKLNCQFIIVECKNYSTDVKNPDLDQIQGRFNPNIGRVGLLISRKVDKKSALFARCNDAYVAQRGLVLPFFDDDLIDCLERMMDDQPNAAEEMLRDRIRDITLK